MDPGSYMQTHAHTRRTREYIYIVYIYPLGCKMDVYTRMCACTSIQYMRCMCLSSNVEKGRGVVVVEM